MKFIWIAFSLCTGYSVEEHWLQFNNAEENNTLAMAKQKCEMKPEPCLLPGADSSESATDL